MTEQDSYSTEMIDGTLVVQFIQSSLVFPDQLRSIEARLNPEQESASPRSATFDFEGVGHISSSVWGEIIRLNKLLRESGRQLRLCNLTDNLQGALDAMKLGQILTVCVTRDDALADLAG